MAKEPDPLTEDMIKSVIDCLLSQGLKKIHFSGGEVLLRQDLEEILRFCCGYGLQVNLTTNGTLLDKDTARWMVDLRVHTVAFSIDGSTEKKHDTLRAVPGAWHNTWAGIDRLKRRRRAKSRGPAIAVNTVVTRSNIDCLPAMHALLRDRGIDSWRLLPVRTAERRFLPSPEQWLRMAIASQQWRPLLRGNFNPYGSGRTARLAARGCFPGQTTLQDCCYAPWFSVFIDADGDVLPCCSGRRSIPIWGNVTRSEIGEILGSPVRREIRASMASGHVFKSCAACHEFLEENRVMNEAAQNWAGKAVPGNGDPPISAECD